MLEHCRSVSTVRLAQVPLWDMSPHIAKGFAQAKIPRVLGTTSIVEKPESPNRGE